MTADAQPSPSQIFSWFGIANFYIFFVILTTSVEDASFNLKGVKAFNMICQVRHEQCLLAPRCG